MSHLADGLAADFAQECRTRVPSTESTFESWLSSLTLLVDAANGAPETTALRGMLAASVASRVLGIGAVDAAAATCGTLFRYLGCTSYAQEDAAMFGDEHEAARLLAPFEPTDYVDIARVVTTELWAAEPAFTRARRAMRLAVEGNAFRRGYMESHCEAAVMLASRLEAASGVRQALAALYERWDGRGGPAGLAGDTIPLPARILHIARESTVHFFLRGGVAGVVRCLERRAGGQLDPELCRALLRSEPFLASFTVEPLWEEAQATLSAHQPHGFVSPPSLDVIVQVFGDFADQKSPWFLGHSRHVTELARGAAQELGLDAATTTLLARAASLLDIGRVGVANRIWDTPGPLGILDWEKVRLHAYVGERICRHLDPALAALVGHHHERSDGSGYARGTRPDLLSSVLAAADVCAALGADRAHRPRYSDEDRARVLAEEVSSGRLRADAVRAVLATLGQRLAPSARTTMLSEREREVLSLVARGMSNKEVGQALGISARTVQAHTIRAYDKLGVRTRAGATLRASELGLLA